MNQGINGWDTDHIAEDRSLAVMDTVGIQDEDDVSKCGKRDEKHDHEDFDVHDNLCNHSDEGTEWLEEAQPVEQLDPHEQDGD